ncbi:MAG: arginase family protein [Chloroflexota bacterium]
MKILKQPIAVLDAPSNLGLRPPRPGKAPGVIGLAGALRAAGIIKGLNALEGGRVAPLPYNPNRDPQTGLLNVESIRRYSLNLAYEIQNLIHYNRFPVVLGGDCSILVGNMLALKQLGHYGLFFIDGHTDFRTPANTTTGGAAGMDLALVTGRGPDALTNILNLKPLVQDRDVVAFGFRDVEDPNVDAYRDIFQTDIVLYGLNIIREIGLEETVARSIAKLKENGVKGFWIHLDADVLNDEIMPAVDSPQIGGMSYAELIQLLRILLSSGMAVGMEITIFDPDLDTDGNIARAFTRAIISAFTGRA